MEIRHAVVPKESRCQRGSWPGVALKMPEQQREVPSVTFTNGMLLDRRMVRGNARDRSSPMQNGQRHLVVPSASGPEKRPYR
jgi:hypothetical protein